MKPNDVSKQLSVGEIVQLIPGKCNNPMFGGCLMVVTVPKDWGAQGYVQGLGKDEQIGGQYYYRATWDEMKLTWGHAPYIAE